MTDERHGDPAAVPPPEDPAGSSDATSVPVCYRHADRETHIRCQRCDRPICPDCMREAAVGFQCPECVREGARSMRQGRTAYGGAVPRAVGALSKTLIGINVAVWLAVVATGGSSGWLLPRLALIPVGAIYPVDGRPTEVLGVSDGAAWQLLTATFTHVEVWHIGFNMLALYVLGPQLELALGRARFLALYLLSGLTGSVAVYLLADPYSMTIGASGAIFGLMAALLVIAVKVRGDVQGLLTLVGINVAITLLGRGFISWQGHLGGFVGGLAIALILVYAPRSARTLWQSVGLGVVALALLGLVAARTLML